MVDVDGRSYRDSTLQDLHDAARIADRLDNIHFVQRPMVPRDIPDPFELARRARIRFESGAPELVEQRRLPHQRLIVFQTGRGAMADPEAPR